MKSIGLVPELYCSNINKSLDFYTKILGFSIVFQRKEEGFAYLKKNNAEIMLEQTGLNRSFMTGKLEHPFGRGINFQIEIEDVETLYKNVQVNKLPIFLPLEEKWYRQNDHSIGNKQFIAQDPDGYLLRFFQDMGTKKI